MKRFILAFALLSSPLAAWAQCGSDEKQAMSCAEGLAWDPQTDSCLPIVTG